MLLRITFYSAKFFNVVISAYLKWKMDRYRENLMSVDQEDVYKQQQPNKPDVSYQKQPSRLSMKNYKKQQMENEAEARMKY